MLCTAALHMGTKCCCFLSMASMPSSLWNLIPLEAASEALPASWQQKMPLALAAKRAFNNVVDLHTL